MGVNAFFDLPFVQIALPIVITFVVAAWNQNKRIDDLRADMNHRLDDTHRRLDEIIKRLDRIETKLDNHENRIVRLEAPLLNR